MREYCENWMHAESRTSWLSIKLYEEEIEKEELELSLSISSYLKHVTLLPAFNAFALTNSFVRLHVRARASYIKPSVRLHFSLLSMLLIDNGTSKLTVFITSVGWTCVCLRMHCAESDYKRLHLMHLSRCFNCTLHSSLIRFTFSLSSPRLVCFRINGMHWHLLANIIGGLSAIIVYIWWNCTTLVVSQRYIEGRCEYKYFSRSHMSARVSSNWNGIS